MQTKPTSLDADPRWQLSEDGQWYEIKPEHLPMFRFANMVQTSNWLEGVSLHNDYADECCPDFSCCGGEIWPLINRKVFLSGGEQNQLNMMMGSLQSLIQEAGVEELVHIAGQEVDPSIH
jgi:hypothetical protein